MASPDPLPSLAVTAAALAPFTAITVVGPTGAVGREVLDLLLRAGVPASRIRCIGPERGVGTQVPYGAAQLGLEPLRASAFARGGLALLCADADTARSCRDLARGSGCLLVDNSAAFRTDPDVPLVVPEVNGREFDLAHCELACNPNCSTILLLVALQPLRAAFGVEEVVVATYQAVSGAGAAGIEELFGETRGALAGTPAQPRVFPEPCAFNVWSHESPIDPATGLNGEEAKLVAESRRIWRDPDLRVSPTCMRVPVVRAHTEAVRVTLRTAAHEAAVRVALAAAAGIRVVDDRAHNDFPTPRKAMACDEVLVGRIRRDPCSPVAVDGASHTWSLVLSGDQLRKGAALNALQVAVLAAAARR